MSFKPASIIIHHSATKDSGTVSWPAIRRYHVDVQKWADIGYHFGLEMVASEIEVFAGRPLDTAGAHTVGQNQVAVGICCVGNYDTDVLPEPMYRKLLALTRGLMRALKIPSTKVFRHGQFAAKSCPGTGFPMARLLADLKKEGL